MSITRHRSTTVTAPEMCLRILSEGLFKKAFTNRGRSIVGSVLTLYRLPKAVFYNGYDFEQGRWRRASTVVIVTVWLSRVDSPHHISDLSSSVGGSALRIMKLRFSLESI